MCDDEQQIGITMKPFEHVNTSLCGVASERAQFHVETQTNWVDVSGARWGDEQLSSEMKKKLETNKITHRLHMM